MTEETAIEMTPEQIIEELLRNPKIYPHPSKKVRVFPSGTRRDLRLPLHVDSATEGKNIAEVRGISRVLLFTEYIERGLAEDRIKFQTELQDYENNSKSSVKVEAASGVASDKIESVSNPS